MACASILIVMALLIIFAGLIAPHDPYKTAMLQRLKPIGHAGHLLGTDELGRDMLTRLLYGGRHSWFLGLAPVAIATVIGGGLGILAGYAGSWVNALIMRATDVLFAFPSVLLAVAVSGALGGGVFNATFSLVLVFVPQIVRVAESATTSVRNLGYVEAARASGVSNLAVIRYHVLPNVLGPVSVYATSLISVSMIIAAGLSFLGLGTKPPEAEWGLMLNTLRSAIYSQPLIAMLPGLCIFVTSICFNLVSDGFRAALAVRD
jgi:peptide/nickel transport system permease protein